MSNFLKSTERITIVLPSNTAVSVDLTKGQDINNCVPEHTVKLTSGATGKIENRFVEVFFTAGTPNKVTAIRGLAGGTVTVSVFVKEYDSAVVTVQQGTFSMAATVATATAAISSVTTTKAYNKINYRVTSAGSTQAWKHGAVKSLFNSATELGFARNGTTGVITGRWYVVSTTGTDFSVAHEQIVMASGDELKEVTVSSKALASTFIIVSYLTDFGSDDVEDGSVVVDQKSATIIRARRAFNDFADDTPDGTAAAAVTVEVQRITAGAGEFTVEQAECNWGDALAKAVVVNAIDQARAVIFAGGFQGCMSSAEISSADVPGNYGTMEYTTDLEVTGTRAMNTAPDGVTAFESVEFGLVIAGIEVLRRRRADAGVWL